MTFKSFDMEPGAEKQWATSKRCVFIVIGVAIVVGFTIGILVGRFATCPDQEPQPATVPDGLFLPGVSQALVQDGDPAIADVLMQSINKQNIENYLRYLSEEPHIAGSQRDHDLAKYIHDFWKENGLDDVTLAPYDVLLSYPDEHEPNLVRLLNASGHVVYESPLEEDILTPGENKTGVVPPFNAYSPNGTVEGDLVYVNYGRVEDYDWLETHNVNVSGKLVIARYGKIFRGSKVTIAQRKGATGVILYSDPADYAGADNDSRVYPHTYWLPPSGTQRGTVYVLSQDPLTPGYPAIGSAYRYPEDQVDLPKIPCHPIGYGIAEPILRAMGGPQAPADWRGGLNVSYNLGPGFVGSEVNNGRIQIRISTRNHRRLSYNVIGVIRGAFEPDRYVLFGNHRDAWVFGSIDPSSGTAVMMEVARVMGQLVKQGRWRPRRSIVFCSWGAEEYGLIGSTEWVEQYIKNLQQRAVAYLNVDIAVQGNYSLRGLGTPMLYKALYDAAKKVPSPMPADRSAGMQTVYDRWAASFPKPGTNIPSIGELGAGSDYAPVLQTAGIPAVDFRYTYNTNAWDIRSYPLYHSMYETFHAVKDIVDRDFECHLAVARLGAEMTRHLADQLIIPFQVSELAEELLVYSGSLYKQFGQLLEQHLDDTSLLNSSIANFTSVVRRFEQTIANINRHHPLLTRMVNDQLMLLNKAFLDPNGLPLRPEAKHLLFAENSNDVYAGSSFPGLADLLFEIDKQPDRLQRWEKVKHHYSVIVFTIQSAASTLEDVTKFVLDHL